MNHDKYEIYIVTRMFLTQGDT